jgi:protease PrsW
MEISPYFYAFLSGLLPALLWLWFFLHEDKKRPEPRSLILLTFIAGMIAVIFVLPIERFFYGIFNTIDTKLLITWATTEEVFKYIAAAIVVLWRKAVDEPIDAMIYMITVALGFAALETTLFLFDPISKGQITESIVTGNLRFLGASLLHVLSSSMVGAALALSFYRKSQYKRMYLLAGLILAIVLHTAFNLLILESTENTIVYVFGFVWLGIIAVLILFEKIKHIKVPLLPFRKK